MHEEAMDRSRGTTRRRLVAGAAAGIGGATAVSLFRTDQALASTMTGVINAKDAPYNAVGNGLTDDTVALQAAMDAADNAGGELFIPPGTYRVSGALLTVNASKLRMGGAGADLTTIQVNTANANESIISLGTRTDVRISDLTLDASHVVDCKQGIHSTGGTGRRNLHIERVRVQNVVDTTTVSPTSWRGIDISPAHGVRILNCEVLGCGQGIFFRESDGEVVVRDCLIADNGSGRMTNGVATTASSRDDRPILVEGCSFRGIQYDEGSNGINGHGVRGFNHRGMRVIGCEFTDIHTAGVLIGAGCHGSKVIGCSFYDIQNAANTRGAGVYVESAAGEPNDDTFGTDKHRGSIVEGNNCQGCFRGVNVSYGAGTLVRGNVIDRSYKDGIINDSEFVVIAENLVTNSYQGGGTSTQLGVAAGITCYSEPAIIRGNLCVDNQTVKTQGYGIAVNDLGHVLAGNVCLANPVGPIYSASDGSTNHMLGNVVRDDGNGRMQTIASAATLSPAVDADFLLVTGNTQISNIANSWQGRVLTLKFDSNITIVHSASGINLSGSANFAAAAGDTLTVIHDGANWYETSRK